MLLWLWRVLPIPTAVRRAYVQVTNPRFLVGAVAYIQDQAGNVLLFHHTYRQRWAWSLPGGYLEVGESPEEGLARELREESGFQVEPGQILSATFFSRGQLDLLIACKISGGSFRPTPEVDACRYVPASELRRILPNHWLLLQHAGLIEVEEAGEP